MSVPGIAVRDEQVLSPAQFRRLADFINQHLGIKMTEVKVPMLQGRLMRRLRALGIPSIEAYEDYLYSQETGEELEAFFNAVTTNKTDFFREPRHFEFLIEKVVPEWQSAQRTPGRFLVWCAGCSTGEEPYTQAMVLSRHKRSDPTFDYAILATDISTRVLGIARKAIYEEARIEPIPEEIRRTSLLRSRGSGEPRFRIASELRERVHFHRLNFMDETYPVADSFDAIFIRNVMIYFDRPTQEAVVNRLCRHLRPGGYLFVGHSESLNGQAVPLRLVGPAVYRKHAGERSP